MPATGFHHVTIVSGDAQANVDFWGGVLGLPLVKKTVNFDDPQTYHLYYGDAIGSPGTILTFFPYGNIRRGKVGRGQATAVALAIAADSLDTWQQRLADAAVEVERGRSVAARPCCRSPTPMACRSSSSASTASTATTVAGVHSVTLHVGAIEHTQQVLEVLGWTPHPHGEVDRLNATA